MSSRNETRNCSPPFVKPAAAERTTARGDRRHHEEYRIALYYCYVDLGKNVKACIASQERLCRQYNLHGRIRVSPEGINGVLSGLYESSLQAYQRETARQLMEFKTLFGSPLALTTTTTTSSSESESEQLRLDVKYCHLRTDLDVASQLFSSLSVKPTRQVVNLYDTVYALSPAAAAAVAEQPQQKVEPDHCSFSLSSQKKNKSSTSSRRKQQRQGPVRPLSFLLRNNQDTLDTNESKATTRCKEEKCTKNRLSSLTLSNVNSDNASIMMPSRQVHSNVSPAPHLSPQEWHTMLLSLSKSSTSSSSSSDTTNNHNDALLMDVRNVYESRIGHFKVRGIPTLLTNIRKYSYLCTVLWQDLKQQQQQGGGGSSMLHGKRRIFMYCTGGVRCERASVHLQAMLSSNGGDGGSSTRPPIEIYQLQGGIQRYLQEYGGGTRSMSSGGGGGDNSHDTGAKDDDTKSSNNECLYLGKNFVFDLRRTDPVVGRGRMGGCSGDYSSDGSIVGTCLLCGAPHDDYDNGHAPSQGREARCCKCRILVLVCNTCRAKVRVWGESRRHTKPQEDDKDDEQLEVRDGQTLKSPHLPELYCGGLTQCIDDGNCNQATII